jgi:hypothetical protein
MSKFKKPLYSWDSCVLLAWLKEETGAPLADMELVVQEIDNNRANLILAVTVYTEILEIHTNPEQKSLLENFLQRSNIVMAETTMAIASKAGSIRDKALSEHRQIKTPDATIIATAIIYDANVLHSLDEKILALNNSDVVDKLAITKPCLLSGQKGLIV